MTVVLILDKLRNLKGYQARKNGKARLGSKYFACSKHGAQKAEELARQADKAFTTQSKREKSKQKGTAK